jgi:large subunit ribosomal protein L6
MACTGLRPSFRRLLKETARINEIPLFLIPSISLPQSRTFATTRPQHSRVGTAPIAIPSEVNLRFFDLPKTNARSRKLDTPTTAIEIKGPLGELTLPIPPYIYTKLDDDGKKITLSVGDPELKHQRAMWGTMRAHMQNTIAGVSEGHICILRLVGVGYRAEITEKPQTKLQPEYEGQKYIFLKLGFAHPVEMGIPKGVKAAVPQPNRILLEGCEKQVVTQFAAEIRAWRKPEPYKGKGIFVNDETIRLKAKKIK